MIPTLPLRLRDRLAGTILAALHDGQARRDLAALGDAAAGAWLGRDEGSWAGPLAARARAATSALAGSPLLPRDPDVGQALRAAATLFEAGLYFEVHEVLEPHWVAAAGETRQALQGLIQVAVAWQHVANDNLVGARSLLVEGSARLRGLRLLGADLDPFARTAAAAAVDAAAGRPLTPPGFPRFEPVDRLDKEEA